MHRDTLLKLIDDFRTSLERDDLDIPAIDALKKALDKYAGYAEKQRAARAMAKVRAVAEQEGYSLEQLLAAGGGVDLEQVSKSATSPGGIKPLYRHPTTFATWTGRGKAPEWLHKIVAEAAGTDDRSDPEYKAALAQAKVEYRIAGTESKRRSRK